MDKHGLYQALFDTSRWLDVIQKGDSKQMNPLFLQAICAQTSRTAIYHSIEQRKYQIKPPHKAEIPKDDGSLRTVYINSDIDRILLAVYNDMLFDLCRTMVHPSCKSYLKGSGCGRTVQQISNVIQKQTTNDIGIKLDLSKYFDSVKIEKIDEVFDKVKAILGPFEMTDIVRDYYHNDTVIADGQAIQKYTSLKQGCPVSAFLADAVLYDIDKEITENYDVTYVRYSDDILIIGPEWRQAFETLQRRLSDMELIVHPRKTEPVFKNQWFKFLGFMLRDNQITLSKNKVQKLEQDIRHRTINSRRKSEPALVNAVMDYLYMGPDDHSWAKAVLPFINVQSDIETINLFVIDAMRARRTGHHNIGHLGVNLTKTDGIIQRSIGKNVSANRKKVTTLTDYLPITKAWYLIRCRRNEYEEQLKTRKETYLCRPMKH